MKAENNAWKKIADSYVEKYSASLRQELEALHKQGDVPSPGLDRRVWAYAARAKRTRAMRVLGGLAAAACVAVALLFPAVWRQNIRTPSAGTSSAAQPGILPLSFTLPAQFTVGSAEQDREKSIYLLDNAKLDPVVLTLEKQRDTAFLETLTPVTLGEEQVYGRSDSGYHLIAFEKQGILYVLTCQYDINTLTDLSRSIL